MSSHEANRLAAVYDVIDDINGRFPTVQRYYRDLTAHDEGTGSHVMGVTITLVDTALRLGLPSRFAALCAKDHDCGKRDVPSKLLRAQHLTVKELARIRTPHMEATRTRIHAIPKQEMPDALKQDNLAVVMAHHELFTNGHGAGPYPRRGGVYEGTERRKRPDDSIQTWQFLLTLSDRADRYHRGMWGTDCKPESSIETELHRLADTITLPFPQIVRDGYIHTVAASATLVTQETLAEAIRVAGIKT